MTLMKGVVRSANSCAVMPSEPTIATPWKKPANIWYIPESIARSTREAIPASAPS